MAIMLPTTDQQQVEQQASTSVWSRFRKTLWNKTFLLVLIPFSGAIGSILGEFTVRMIGRTLGYEKCLQDFCHAAPKIVQVKQLTQPID